MQLNSKFKALLAGATLALGLAACGGSGDAAQSAGGANAAPAADTVAAIKEKGVIRIGVFGDKPPFGYVDSQGKNQGFDVEIAKAVDFAAPYMKVALGVVSPDKKPVTDIAQLKDQTLLVNKGTTADAFFSKNHPEVKLLKFDQNTETFDALKDGRGVALAHDNALLWAWAKENPGYEVAIGNIGPAEVIAPAVKKGDKALLDWVNAEIAAMKKDGRLKAAYEKTLKPVYGDKVTPEDILAE